MAHIVKIGVELSWGKNDARPEAVYGLSALVNDDKPVPVIIGGVHVGDVQIETTSSPVGGDRQSISFAFSSQFVRHHA